MVHHNVTTLRADTAATCGGGLKGFHAVQAASRVYTEEPRTGWRRCGWDRWRMARDQIECQGGWVMRKLGDGGGKRCPNNT